MTPPVIPDEVVHFVVRDRTVCGKEFVFPLRGTDFDTASVGCQACIAAAFFNCIPPSGPPEPLPTTPNLGWMIARAALRIPTPGANPMTNTSEVERVARAICEARGEWPDGFWMKADDEGCVERTFLEWAMIDARAAIAALRNTPQTDGETK